MKVFRALVLIAVAAVVCSCGGGKEDKPDGPITPSVVAVSSVSLSKTEAELVVGNTLQLTATVSPSNATDKSVTWNSSNASVATVTPTGLVSAKAEGTANIMASCGGKSAICKLTVKKPVVAVASVELDKPEITLDAEETYTLKATVKPDNATDKTVTWASSKPDVATVDSNGKVTGVNNGVASVTATCCGKSASCKVTVVVKVKSITLSQASATISVGEDPLILTATVSPDNAADKTVTWSTNNASVATVSNGKVTAVTAGTATITAKAGDKSAICTVSVTAGHEYVDLGLPSGIKWATSNIGAAKPEEAGEYFAWAETESKSDYSWPSYIYGKETYLNKYCLSSTNGSVDNKTVLDMEDDVAHKNWGDNWRLPTKAEFSELISKCTWRWTTQNGVNGYQVTGPNNNSIFLPITGYKDGTRHAAATTTGYYWSSSLDSISTHGRRLIFNASSHRCSRAGRYYGMSVRPVYGAFVPVSSLTLNKYSIKLKVGEQLTLTSTVSPSNATDRTVFWMTSDASVASVKNGVVKAIKEGTASIYARAGNKMAICHIIVTDPNTLFLRFKSTGNTTITLCKEGNISGVELYYRDPEDETWYRYPFGAAANHGEVLTLQDGDELDFIAKENNASVFSSSSIVSHYYFKIGGSGTIAASGNIMALIYHSRTEASSNIPGSYCFYELFKNCDKLTEAPELPATTLVKSCYDSMFYGCTRLTKAPELPATSLAENCYKSMFYGCTSLTKAPDILPAKTLAKSCYAYMFYGCTGLTKAPELAATTLAESCCSSMFYECKNLTKAPDILPAKTLAKSCYSSMFYDCFSLTKAPELPATTLAESCYSSMFYSCTSLTKAPDILPAKTLAKSCYSSMFYWCRSLTKAPELPATTLAESCCSSMFYSCESLTKAPDILPATTLAKSCYSSMFYWCTGLTKAPELPAATLVENCYEEMFVMCINLNYVKALFITQPSSTYTNSWLTGVCTEGTFVKSKKASWKNSDVRGVSGIPVLWTVHVE